MGVPASCGWFEVAHYPLDVTLRGTLVRWATFYCGNDCYAEYFRASLRAPEAVTRTEAPGWDTSHGEPYPKPPVRRPETVRGVRMTLAKGVVTLRRVSDGRTRLVRAPTGRVVDADLDAAGLFYAWNARTGTYRGHVRFVPFARLLG